MLTPVRNSETKAKVLLPFPPEEAVYQAYCQSLLQGEPLPASEVVRVSRNGRDFIAGPWRSARDTSSVKKRDLLHEDKNRIRQLYLKYGSAEEVARLTGFNPITVRKYAGDTSRKNKVDPEIIFRCYQVNGTLEGTAVLLGLSKTTVWRRIQSFGGVIRKGATDSIRLYKTLRRRVTVSSWRKGVLERDGYRCVTCKEPSNVVHHKVKLSSLRDQVFMQNTSSSPFDSFQALRAFTDAVMALHCIDDGEVLCRKCHEIEHSSSGSEAA